MAEKSATNDLLTCKLLFIKYVPEYHALILIMKKSLTYFSLTSINSKAYIG